MRKKTINLKNNSLNKNDFTSSFKKENFMNAVDKTKQYISDGDVMQVVLSQRFSKNLRAIRLICMKL